MFALDTILIKEVIFFMSLWIFEIVVSLVMIVLSVAAYVVAGTFRISFNLSDIGAQAFPRAIVIAMSALAVMQIIISIKNRNSDEKIKIGQWATLLSGIALLFVYISLIPILGYFVTTPIFVVGFLVLQGNRNWLQIVLVSSGFCLFVYVVFINVLRVTLP